MIKKPFKDIELSRLGLGNMRYILTDPENGNSPIDRPKAHAVIDSAYENGINYFDTAYVYNSGDSERCLGEAMQKYPRDSFYIADKFHHHANPDYEAVFEEQLKRLQKCGYPVKNILDVVQNDNETNTIVYTSAYFQPCSETFSDRYHFIGPSIRPVTQPMEKTAEKTVYISMGTVNQNREFYRNCISVLGRTDWQVIISMGTNPEHFEELPDNVRVFESVDQMAVLEIADAFLTHCGMNSASEGLYFRVPLVLFPQTPEQDAVAKRTEELGAGVRLPGISEDEILNTLKNVLDDPSYRESASIISDSFRKCGGAAEARAFLEEVGK